MCSKSDNVQRRFGQQRRGHGEKKDLTSVSVPRVQWVQLDPYKKEAGRYTRGSSNLSSLISLMM